MKDAPLLRGSLAERSVALFAGLLLIAVAIVSMLESGLGVPPWDVLHMGIAAHTPLSLGTAAIAVGLVIVAIAWIAGAPPGIGTIANAVVIGLAIDLFSSIGWVQRLSDGPLLARVGLVALGVWLFGVGSACYIGAGMGAGPRDSFMLALTRRTGWRIGLVRGSIEVAVLLAASRWVGSRASARWRSPCSSARRWSCRSGCCCACASPIPVHTPRISGHSTSRRLQPLTRART